ncbi:hypothetical protein E4633_11245 [Geomonas terrae]|uniref:Uncharacterized protein n=2 Tax=Geomonas terrae TaxID=2562681 RepID=A0A4S1CGY6_9BACT|nr:hypothetical protein E4633_11245 [Geomonas terrae]
MTALLTVLTGCMAASTAVSGIGARALYGGTDYNPSAETVSIKLRDAALITGTAAPILPYRSLVIDGKNEIVEVITLNYNDIVWTGYSDGMQTGKVKCIAKGKETDFDVRLKNHNTSLYLEHRYRQWYGYPAQGLLIATVPIEGALNALVLGVGALYAMTGG